MNEANSREITSKISHLSRMVKTKIDNKLISFEANVDIVISTEALDLMSIISNIARDKPQVLSSPDPVFNSNVKKAIELINKWHFKARATTTTSLQLSTIKPQKRDQDNQKTAMFFSGGVDSFYTLLQRQEEIDQVIFVQGFDISFDNYKLTQKALSHVQEAVTEFGKDLIFVRTNIRQFLDSYVRWGECGHGVAMAVVSHLLSSHFNSVYIPSSYHHSQLFPWGTHPDLDHLWSSSLLRIIHDNCDVFREEKFAYILDNPTVLKNLRVCINEKEGEINCNYCRKCLSAKLHLMEHGKLKQSATFNHVIRARDLLKADTYNILSSKHNLRQLWASPQTRKLALALGLSYYRGKLSHNSLRLLRKLKTIFSTSIY